VGVGKRIEGQGLRGAGKRRHVETYEGLDVEASRNPEVPRMGIVGTHPGSFRKSGKRRTCGIRNLEEGTEKRK